MSLTQAKTATNKQSLFTGRRLSSKKANYGTKSTTVAAYTGVFLLIMSMVAIGYQPPQKSDKVASALNPVVSGGQSKSDQPSVDQIVATSVAAGIAARADLPVAPNIANQSVSLSIQSTLSQTDTTTIVKPQIIQPSADTRVVKEYVTKSGDTVPSVAEQFGISANTVKWANNLSTDSVEANKTLKILPVDGILYTVKDGDTLQSIASKFNTTVDNITVFNDLELSGIVKDKQLILPSGVLPATERPGYSAPRSNSGLSSPLTSFRYAGGFAGGDAMGSWRNTKSTTPGNTNAWGNCTWWAWERRAEMGMRLPSGAIGHAAEWAYSLGRAGYRVDQTPSYGALIQNGGGYGHVGVVEVVNADGSIIISEMNNYSAGGYNIINKRLIPASALGNFNFIH